MFAGTGVDGRSGEYRSPTGCGDATDDEDSCGCDIRSQDEMRSELMWFEDVWFEDCFRWEAPPYLNKLSREGRALGLDASTVAYIRYKKQP